MVDNDINEMLIGVGLFLATAVLFWFFYHKGGGSVLIHNSEAFEQFMLKYFPRAAYIFRTGTRPAVDSTLMDVPRFTISREDWTISFSQNPMENYGE